MGKENPKKRRIIPLFYGWFILTLCKATHNIKSHDPTELKIVLDTMEICNSNQ